jgi:23S rRNA (cytidine2498-2'-O)-methyltransferase
VPDRTGAGRAVAHRPPPHIADTQIDNVVVAQCRAGFEPETAHDMHALAGVAGATPSVAFERGSGYVIATLGASLSARRWNAALVHRPPVFARSVFTGTGPWALLAPGSKAARADRVTPLLTAAQSLGDNVFAGVWLEYPDTNDGKQLSPLARALESRLRGHLAEGGERRLHVFMPDGATAYVGTSERATGSAWPMGIPRLHLPRAAPSRSTQKLAEAFVTFLGDRQHALLRPGLRAVDLGAAPGGWTWQLAHRGLRVTAVDNAALKGAIAQDPLVTHVRADGLHWRPPRPVEWLTCDIVETPSRIATLVAGWIADGAARHAIFNLKLPMKKRYEEVERCRALIADTLARAGMAGELRLRQLYHDREEVTGYLTRAERNGDRRS